MAMRLADTFLVHLRSCFAILFSGQTPHWGLPRFFGNAARLHCPMDQAYEYRTDVCNYCVCQLWVHTLAVKWLCDASRARAADDSIGGPQMLKFLNALAALAAVGTFVIAFLIDIVSRIAQPIRDILKTQMRAYPRLDGAV